MYSSILLKTGGARDMDGGTGRADMVKCVHGEEITVVDLLPYPYYYVLRGRRGAPDVSYRLDKQTFQCKQN